LRSPARAPRLELMERFAELAHSSLRTEMDLHRAYAADWGISRGELERERPHPATRAYTDFLLRTAALGDFSELVAALLPCMWGYSELGQRLAQDRRPAEERYARWIEMYSGEEFAKLARWCRESATRSPTVLGRKAKVGCETRSWRAVATSSSSGSQPGALRLESPPCTAGWLDSRCRRKSRLWTTCRRR
jgi:thiaminase